MYSSNPNKYSQAPTNQEVIRMTAEEERIFKECDKEGLWKKGIPYASIGTLLTYGALNYGLLKPNLKYGYAPAMLTASCIGGFIGIISHKATCLQKVLDLPNSSLKQQIEVSTKRHQFQTTMPMGQVLPEQQIQSQSAMISELQTDDYQSPNDFDTYTAVNTDGDQQDDLYMLEPLDKYAGVSTTYEELRQKNREEYMRSQMARIPLRSDIPRGVGQTTPQYGGDNIPFDRDRVPQYQLND